MIELINKKKNLELTEPVGGTSIEVDSQLSLDSANPVQNKVITNKINSMDESIGAIPQYTIFAKNRQDGSTYLVIHDIDKPDPYEIIIPASITVDDVFDPLSENAQSGLAVQEVYNMLDERIDNIETTLDGLDALLDTV